MPTEQYHRLVKDGIRIVTHDSSDPGILRLEITRKEGAQNTSTFAVRLTPAEIEKLGLDLLRTVR